MENDTYLVTGANGFLASWIIHDLLAAGHTVHGTVRNASNPKKTQHLTAIAEGKPGTLKLFSADLLKPGSFAEAMQGVTVVMHTASPFIAGKVKNPEQNLVKPAVQGTENVLDTVNQTDSVRRVVLTSSVVAVWGDNDEYLSAANQQFDESHWNTTNTVAYQPYNYSKVAAEQRAWDIAKAQTRWDLVVINPGFVLGPALTDNPAGASQEVMMQMLTGQFKTGAPGLIFGTTDVREVATAHLQAAKRPESEGRHILVADTMSMFEIAQQIEKAFPGQYKVPAKELPKFMLYLVGPMLGFPWRFVKHNVGVRPNINNAKSREKLGINYRPLSETIRDQVAKLQEVGADKKK